MDRYGTGASLTSIVELNEFLDTITLERGYTIVYPKYEDVRFPINPLTYSELSVRMVGDPIRRTVAGLHLTGLLRFSAGRGVGENYPYDIRTSKDVIRSLELAFRFGERVVAFYAPDAAQHAEPVRIMIHGMTTLINTHTVNCTPMTTIGEIKKRILSDRSCDLDCEQFNPDSNVTINGVDTDDNLPIGMYNYKHSVLQWYYSGRSQPLPFRPHQLDCNHSSCDMYRFLKEKIPVEFVDPTGNDPVLNLALPRGDLLTYSGQEIYSRVMKRKGGLTGGCKRKRLR